MQLHRLARLIVLLAFAAPFARGQEPHKSAPAPEPAPQASKPHEDPVHVEVPVPGDDAHAQMKKLIGEIELGLRRIDKLLAEAGARGASQPGSPTALRELVQHSQDEGQRVVQGIDKLLELANHPHPPGGA